MPVKAYVLIETKVGMTREVVEALRELEGIKIARKRHTRHIWKC